MKALKTLDLEKAFILLSLVLIPLALGWIYYLYGQVDAGDKEYKRATGGGGYIEKVGTLAKELRQISSSEGNKDVTDPGRYFERVVLVDTAGGGVPGERGITSNDFTVNERSPRSIKVRGGSAKDLECEIAFAKAINDRGLSREFINALVVNAEKNSKVWRLRQLSITNKQLKSNSKDAPPEEIKDMWSVKKVIFARRTSE